MTNQQTAEDHCKANTQEILIHLLLKQVFVPTVPVRQVARKHTPVPDKDDKIQSLGSTQKEEVKALTSGMLTLRVHKRMGREYKGYRITNHGW